MEKTIQNQYISGSDTASKGQKISAAIYLVTSHLSDTDPIKNTLRTRAVQLIDTTSGTKDNIVVAITELLGAAVLARIVNERNAGIIIREVKRYSASGDESAEDIAKMFIPPLSRTNEHLSIMSDKMSFKVGSDAKNIINKSNRQDKILSYINQKKSVAIKDIAILFPDVSEKTIQRELTTLVALGKIRKHGSKRWSLYLALTQ